MIRRCLVFLSGGIAPENYNDGDLTICADSGALSLLERGRYPDYLIGDMDSIDEAYIREMEEEGTSIHRYPVDKDMSDGELSIRFAISLGPDRIEIYGGVEGRSDHILSNYQMLHLIPGSIDSRLHLGYDEIILIKEGESRKFASSRSIVSILPASQGARISLLGLRYEINDLELPLGSTRCIHNETCGGEFVVNVKGGSVFVLLSDRK